MNVQKTRFVTKQHHEKANHHSKSSWSFGWSEKESPKESYKKKREEEKVISSNMYANGSNQNAGNFLTEKPTTKIHAPPGGSSQIIFG
eukprot:snap_masked-scaffold_2-processed-gene-23.40-mRNA-1 protein AED:0.11 eAED:0.26 QI:0/0/0/0.66/1/1/3/0/87